MVKKCAVLVIAFVCSIFSAPLPALGQGRPFVVPESTKNRGEDRGVRAHTNYVIPLPGTGTGPGGGFSPAQVRSIYSLPSTGGSGAIAIVTAYHYPFALNDFNVYSRQFGLPTETSTNPISSLNKVLQVVFATGTRPRVDVGWSLEAAIDIEIAHAIAPGAKIYLVEAATNSFEDLFVAVKRAGKLPGVKEISMSWGGDEFPEEIAFDSIFTHRGIVYIAATGDMPTIFQEIQGQSYPAASPNVIAAGGTTVFTDEDGVFLEEQGWNSGSGGISLFEPVPAYQAPISAAIDDTVAAVNLSIDIINGIFNYGLPHITRHRAIADLAFDADPGTGPSIYCTANIGGWFQIGGTSVSAPALAGVLNLAGTASGTFPKSTAEELARIYSGVGSANFRDISAGYLFDDLFNPLPCLPGWDAVTGVGAPIGLGGL